jgi:Ribosomal protein S8e
MHSKHFHDAEGAHEWQHAAAARSASARGHLDLLSDGSSGGGRADGACPSQPEQKSSCTNTARGHSALAPLSHPVPVPASTFVHQASNHVQRKLKERARTHKKLEQLLADQFSTGRLYACVSSRPGQCGRCDGYILEGEARSDAVIMMSPLHPCRLALYATSMYEILPFDVDCLWMIIGVCVSLRAFLTRLCPHLAPTSTLQARSWSSTSRRCRRRSPRLPPERCNSAEARDMRSVCRAARDMCNAVTSQPRGCSTPS